MKISEFLTEAVFDLNRVVDSIYNAFFKELADSINRDDSLKALSMHETSFSSHALPKNKFIVAANKLNPVTIKINDTESDRGNAYVPGDETIYLTVNQNAYQFIMQYGTLSNAVRVLGASLKPKKAAMLQTEFTPERIKGSIHHELSHWLDDTLHNKHITKMIDKAKQTSTIGQRDQVMHQRKKDVALTSYERDAQIHNIIQLKRKHGRRWNNLSFEEMIRLNPSLALIYDTAKVEGWLDEWKQLLLRRMHREGLLGKSMVKF